MVVVLFTYALSPPDNNSDKPDAVKSVFFVVAHSKLILSSLHNSKSYFCFSRNFTGTLSVNHTPFTDLKNL